MDAVKGMYVHCCRTGDGRRQFSGMGNDMANRIITLADELLSAINNRRKWEMAERFDASVKVGETPHAQGERVKRCMQAGREKIAALYEIRDSARLLVARIELDDIDAKPLYECIAAIGGHATVNFHNVYVHVKYLRAICAEPETAVDPGPRRG